MMTKTAATPFWNLPLPELLQQLDTSSEGLASEEAHQRLIRFGANHLRRKSRLREGVLLLSQFKSPIILILLSAAGLSVFLGNPTDAFIILVIVFVSGLLGYWQERGASHAVERLLAIVRVTAEVVPDGTVHEIATDEIVPGDILLLSAGAGVSGDCRVLESKDLFVNEATLTEETYPIEKDVTVFTRDTSLNQRTNCLWMGTHIISGSARAIIVRTGKNTEFVGIAQRLTLRPPETEFERGVRRFGYLLLEVTRVKPHDSLGERARLIAAQHIHTTEVFNRREPFHDDLLPGHSFRTVRQIDTDDSRQQLRGQPDREGHRRSMQTGRKKSAYFFTPTSMRCSRKVDEEPYDFVRKRLSICVAHGDRRIMITKGALPSVLSICSSVESTDGSAVGMDVMHERLLQRFADLSSSVFRVIGHRLSGSRRGIEDHQRP